MHHVFWEAVHYAVVGRVSWMSEVAPVDLLVCGMLRSMSFGTMRVPKTIYEPDDSAVHSDLNCRVMRFHLIL